MLQTQLHKNIWTALWRVPVPDQVSKRFYAFYMTIAIIEVWKGKEKTLIVRERGENKNSEVIWKMCRQQEYNKQLISSRWNAGINWMWIFAETIFV